MTMKEIEQLYIEADKILQILSEDRGPQDLNKLFPIKDITIRDGAIGLLKKERLIDDTMSGGFILLPLGNAYRMEGGFYKRFRRKRCLHIATYVAAMCSLVTLLITIVNILL